MAVPSGRILDPSLILDSRSSNGRTRKLDADRWKEVTRLSKTTNLKKTMLVAVTALVVAGSVTGAALAASAGSKAPRSAPHAITATTPDTDNIQSGDQTPPDTGNQAPEPNSGAKAKAKTAADETGGEDTSTETGNSDGPGGHADPPGQDVNHEFSGAE